MEIAFLNSYFREIESTLVNLNQDEAIIVLSEEGRPAMVLLGEEKSYLAQNALPETPLQDLQDFAPPLLIVQGQSPLDFVMQELESFRGLQQEIGLPGVVLVDDETSQYDWKSFQTLNLMWSNWLLANSNDPVPLGQPDPQVLIKCKYQHGLKQCNYMNTITQYNPNQRCQNPNLPKHTFQP